MTDPSRRFADVDDGDSYDCGSTHVTSEQIVAFAEQFDPLPIHTDPEAAAASPFGGLVASGIHTFALTQPPVVEHFYGDSTMVASMGIEELRFPAPLRPDRDLHVRLEVLDTRVAGSDPRKGVVTTRRTAETGDWTVLDLTNNTLWRRDVD